MKKIISLILVVCMLLPMALPVFAEETSKSFYGTIAVSRANSMEWVIATDGETQTFEKNISDSCQIATDSESGAKWLYFKVNVGHGWNFSETTASTLKISFYRVYAGDVNVYVFPSDKNEWKKAVNATEGGLTGKDKFAVPVLENASASGTYTTSSNTYNKTCSVKLTADTLNKCYNQEDGCLYMTLGITSTGSSVATFQKASGYAEDNRYHTLTLYGTQDLGNPDISFDNAKSTVEIIGNDAVVTTTAGAGTAKLIAASYEGNKVSDVVIHDLNGADGENGKFTVDISKIVSGPQKAKAFLWASDMITPLANVAEKNFKLKQETFPKANKPSSTYNTFCNMSEAAFIIPGLNQGIVPQGIAYREDTDQFYLSGYFKDSYSSAISVIDGKTGETVGEYFLKNEDGTAYAGHVGGIAVYGNNLYITNGCYLYTVSLENIDKLGYTGNLCIEGKINLSIGDLSNETGRGCSYVDCSDGYLWVGNFYQKGDSSYDKPISEEYPALVRGYKLDPTQPNGFAAEYKTKNTTVYDYIPEVMYNVSEEKIQGGSVSGDYLILSMSSGSNPSKLYVYDTTKPTAEATMLLDGDREVPIKSLSTKRTVTALPFSEDMAIVGDDVYLSFESGSVFYRYSSGAYPTDSVWKTSLSKLLDREPETPVEPEEPEEPVVPENAVMLTLKDCDEEGETAYKNGSKVTLVTPTKTAKTGTYTFKNWTDGENFYNSGDEITLTEDLTLTAVWEFAPIGAMSLSFDDMSRMVAGPYNEETETYDNTVKSVTSGATGTVNVNTNTPISSGTYVDRNYVYVKIDLKNEYPAKSVTLDLNGVVNASATSYVYVNQVDAYPLVGETMATGTRVASYTLTSTTSNTLQSYDITALFNKSIGSTLYLKIYGWYGYTKRSINAVQVKTGTIALSYTPSDGQDFTISFNEGAESFMSGYSEEITLPDCTHVIAGRKFAGWSDGKAVYPAGAKYLPEASMTFTATYEANPETYTDAQKALDGKKVIFIGNSYVYYGNCTIQMDRTAWTWADRSEDVGYFHQLCKQNNIDVKVRNWCFSGHTTYNTFNGPCDHGIECDGINHEDHIEDKYMDYVIISPHASKAEENNIESSLDYIFDFFRQYNPNVKFVILGNHATYGVTTTGTMYNGLINHYAKLKDEGAIMANWGKIVKDIVDGTNEVPGATMDYNRNTFVTTSDGYHENALSGYLTALTAYCAITGDSAQGQPYEFCWDTSIHSKYNLEKHRSNYYPNIEDTNFLDIFHSPADMLGLQKLVDKYFEDGDEGGNTEGSETLVSLTYDNWDEEGTLEYAVGTQVTLPEPTKTIDGVSYTFMHWSDGKKTYNAGDVITLTGDIVLTAVWEEEYTGDDTVEFDDKSLVMIGHYDETTATTDNTVKSITSGISGTTNINARNTYSSTSGYLNRPRVYAKISIDENQEPAESALLNLNITSIGTGKVYVYQTSAYPTVDEEEETGTLLSTVTLSSAASGTDFTVDITDAYNNAIGSDLCLKIYGWYGNDLRSGNAITLAADKLNLTVTTAVTEKVNLTLEDCDEAGTTEYNEGDKVTLITPVKTAKTATYTFAGWTDGEKTYNAGDVITINEDITLTATWTVVGNSGEFTVEFDDKSLAKAGHYDETTATTDNTIKSITSGITGSIDINARNTYSSNQGYLDRPYVYVKLNLKNEVEADKVLLNLKGSGIGTGKIYAYSVSNAPEVGEEMETGTLAATFNVSQTSGDTLQSIDITDAYNSAVGSELYLKLYGWYGNDKRYTNAVTLDADSLSLTVSTNGSGAYIVSFDGGAENITAEADEVITLPECTAEVEGQIFTGWSDGTNVYKAGATYTVTGSVAFAAVFVDGVTITYNNEGVITAKGYAKGETIALATPEAPTAQVGTYTFAGWFDGTTTYNPGDSITLNENLTLTAVWTYKGGEGTLKWVDSWYFANPYSNKAVTDTTIGTLTKSPTGTKYLFRGPSTGEEWTSAYFAKIDLRNLKNVASSALSVYHTKFNTQVKATVYGVEESAYNAFFADAVSGSTVNTADLPTGTSIITKTFSSSSDAGTYRTDIDITKYIAEKVAAGADYAYIMLTNSATASSATTDSWRVSDFASSSYIKVKTAGMSDISFDVGADTITAMDGTEITLPDCSTVPEGKVFAGWTDGTNVYEASATFTVNGDITLTATYKAAPGAPVNVTLKDCDEAGTTEYESNSQLTLITPTKTAKTGTYTFKNWTDGENIYNSGDEITLIEDLTLTAEWEFSDDGIIFVPFDDVSLVRYGSWSSTNEAYDDTVESVQSGITGTQDINARKPYSSSNGYFIRQNVYVKIDLKNEPKAEKVLLNLNATRSGTATNTVYVNQVERYPEAGETIETGTRIATYTLNSSSSGKDKVVDITEAYNSCVGSTLYLRLVGWAYDEKKSRNYITLNTGSLKLTVSPTEAGDYAVLFDKGADDFMADAGEVVTLPECANVIVGKKFTGWSDGSTVYPAGSEYTVNANTQFTATYEIDPETQTAAQKALDGKKVIFIGNSFIYYGRTVGAVNEDSPELSKRADTKGGFVQLCKANNIDVSVTNWTIGSHKLSDMVGETECSVCKNGTIHLEYLTDKDYDYVVFSPSSTATQEANFEADVDYIINTFKSVNPDVKFVCLGNVGAYGYSSSKYAWADPEANYAAIEAKGVKVVDWGKLVKGIIDGTYTVPGATETYKKSTFIVKDGYHPNLLTGHITTLFAYCAITGESALGQYYGYITDPATAPVFDLDGYVNYYYTNGDADTNFPEIIKSESEMRAIQQLIDTYLAE